MCVRTSSALKLAALTTSKGWRGKKNRSQSQDCQRHLVQGMLSGPESHLLNAPFFAGLVKAQILRELPETLVIRRIVTAASIAKGYGLRADQLTHLVKTELASLISVHTMRGDLGAVLYLADSVPEELLHRVYVRGEKEKAGLEKAVKRLRTELQATKAEMKGGLPNAVSGGWPDTKRGKTDQRGIQDWFWGVAV